MTAFAVLDLAVVFFVTARFAVAFFLAAGLRFAGVLTASAEIVAPAASAAAGCFAVTGLVLVTEPVAFSANLRAAADLRAVVFFAVVEREAVFAGVEDLTAFAVLAAFLLTACGDVSAATVRDEDAVVRFAADFRAFVTVAFASTSSGRVCCTGTGSLPTQ